MSASELVTGSQINVEIQYFVSACIYESATETRVIIANFYESDSTPLAKVQTIRRFWNLQKQFNLFFKRNNNH